MKLNPFLPVRGKSRIHYAWIVLVAGMTMNAISGGEGQSFGVFIDPLVDQFGWSRGAISLAYSLMFLTSVPVSLGAGWLADRVGGRRLVFFGAVMFIIANLLVGTIGQLWQFYLFYGLLLGGLSRSIFSLIPIVTVTRWFQSRLGLITGIMWLSVGIAPVAVAPVMRWLIVTLGWRETFFLTAIFGGAVMLLAAYLFRDNPEDVGIAPYGAAQPLPETAAPATAVPARAITFSMVRATSAFWLLSVIHLMGCAGHAIPLAHVVSMAILAGVPGLAAAGLISAASGFSLVSRFGMSLLAEKLGGKRVLSIAFFFQAAPILLLLWAKEPWSFYLFAALFGLGYGGEMVAFPIINRQYYGAHAPLTTIYSYQMAGAMLGMALGGFLGGALFDLTGGYTWSVIAAAAFSFSGLLPIFLLPRWRPGRVIVSAAPQPQPASPR